MRRKQDSGGREKCPFCGSTDTVWRGYRQNLSSKKRMRLCKSCGRKFTPDNGFLRMRHRPEDIMYAVKLYRSGNSTSEVVKKLGKKGVNISRWTVILWYRKFRDRVK